MADGFLGRWSRRKLDVKEGKPLEAEPVPAEPVRAAPPVPAAQPVPAGTAELPATVPEAPPLTLDDVQALRPESDFSAFAGRNVDPQVRNAAMKKLFTDPHYNIMDRMDIYIDDYSKPDPIPPEMMRQLVSAKFLKLFDAEEEEEERAKKAAAQLQPPVGPRDAADDPAAQSVAQSGAPSQAVPAPPDHADPDLRLQQDHASPGKNPGGGAQ